MAVARHPVARIAPPAPAIISASRARVGERDGERGPLIELLKTDGRPRPPRSSHRAAGSAPRAREWVREMVDAIDARPPTLADPLGLARRTFTSTYLACHRPKLLRLGRD